VVGIHHDDGGRWRPHPPTGGDAYSHGSTAPHDHINFYGIYSFDIETELNRTGHRPLPTTA
jgi:hypothetical protein